MDVDDMNRIIQRRQVEISLQEEFESSLPERVRRFMEVKPHWLVPPTQFAAPSSECSLLFRDGHYYECIALTQAVAEALVRFLCQRNSWRPTNEFEKNVDKLLTRQHITKESAQALHRIWEQRDDYHHLNPGVETDRRALEQLAREKIGLLVRIEKEVFDFVVVDGKVRLTNPKYWDIKDNKAQVFLRLEP